MSQLVSNKQIDGNLRRTAEYGLISLINHQQLEDLSFKFFGIKDEYGNIIGYQCPYSGKIYTDYKDIVLEHIVPVSSKGGTVLFNCIPTSKEVNGTDQKGAKHLIEWWTNSSYWNQDTPLRLEKIVNYVLDGYEQIFNEYTIEEVESSYLDIETDESILYEEEEENINPRTESKILKKEKNNGIHSYLGFLYDCINTLEKYNINTQSIKERLQQLQEQNIFKDIDKYQLYQNIIQKLVKSRIGNNNSSYLTYTLNFDIKKLMDSINLDNEKDIYNELNSRLQKIEQLLKENNLSTIEYFKSLKDIQDIDILYKNNVSQEEIKLFIENIKIGSDTKIEIFINMLNKGNSKILKQGNKETLEGYPSIKLSHFWNTNKDKIRQKLMIELKDNPIYDKARELIEINDMTINVEKQIPIFIDMLNKGNERILKQRNNETLEGYSNINLANFWTRHQGKVKQKLFLELKDNPEYETARKLIEINEISIKLEKRILIFIDMLNKGNERILKYENNETLEGYPNINLAVFWSKYQDRIKQKLFDELKDDPTYDKARELLTKYETENDIDKKIEIFINMLNKGNIKILKRRNNENLEGYPNINLANFWNTHNKRIKQKLFVELKDDPIYDKARELIEINEMSINIEKQIPIFIDMLNKGNTKILKQGNKETLEGYPTVKLSFFWNLYNKRIKQKLFVELKDEPTYNKARNLIEINEMTLSVEKQIPIFINMLNQGNDNILKFENDEKLEGYPNINLAGFWIRHQDRIKQKLFVELKDDQTYEKARELLTKYETENDIDKKIEIFINMLNKGNTKILKQGNKETLEGYSSINLTKYWSLHQDKIRQKLFVELKDDSTYDKARKLIEINDMTINVEKQIPIFIDMLNNEKSEILKEGNKETLEGYPNINLSGFWRRHQERIKQKLFVELKDNSKYDKARKLIEINDMTINVEKQIPIFIDMLNKGKSEILKKENKETLEGYPSINLSGFWHRHKDKIKQKLFIELKDNPEYNKARELITIYETKNDIDKKIEIFIDMLNKGNDKILKQGNKETLEGYSSINLTGFWNDHQDKIKQKLFVGLKAEPKYDKARELLMKYETENNIDAKIEIFIDMLNKGNNKILKKGNKERLEGYSNINLAGFWIRHQDRIKQKLFIELKDDPTYNKAREMIMINEVKNNIDTKIEIFINMLNKGNSKILKQGNKETLEGYPSIKLSHFWNTNKDKIRQKLMIELKDNPIYDKARKLIEINDMTINVEKQIPIFIDMLNKGNTKIIKHGNKETLEGYPSINLSNFWNEHQDKIRQKLFIELKENPKYNKARKLIEINDMTINVEKQIPIFIDMLNKGDSKILKQGNKETLEGYPNINLSGFWTRHQDKIKQKLFIELKDNLEYNTAKQTVLTYFKVSSYEELEVKSKKSKKLKEDREIKLEIEKAIEFLDKVDMTEQEQRKRA